MAVGKWRKILQSNNLDTAATFTNNTLAHPVKTLTSDISDVTWDGTGSIASGSHTGIAVAADVDTPDAGMLGKALQIGPAGTPVWGKTIPANIMLAGGGGGTDDLTGLTLPIATNTADDYIFVDSAISQSAAGGDATVTINSNNLNADVAGGNFIVKNNNVAKFTAAGATGDITAAGGATIGGTTTVGGGYGYTGITLESDGDIFADGSISVVSTAYFANSVQIGSDSGVGNAGYEIGGHGVSISSTGNISANGTLRIDGTSTLTGNTEVNGTFTVDLGDDGGNEIAVTANAIGYSSSVTSTWSNTQTSSADANSPTVSRANNIFAGGVKAADMWITGDIYNVANITSTGDIAAGGSITADGQITADSMSIADGAVTINVGDTIAVDEYHEELKFEMTGSNDDSIGTQTYFDSDDMGAGCHIKIHNLSAGSLTIDAETLFYFPVRKLSYAGTPGYFSMDESVAGHITGYIHADGDTDGDVTIAANDTEDVTFLLETWPENIEYNAGLNAEDVDGNPIGGAPTQPGDIAYGFTNASAHWYASDPGDALTVQFGQNVIFDAGGIMSTSSNFATTDQFIALNVASAGSDDFANTATQGIIFGTELASSGNPGKGCKLFNNGTHLNITNLLDQVAVDVQDQQAATFTGYKGVKLKDVCFGEDIDSTATNENDMTLGVDDDNLYLFIAN